MSYPFCGRISECSPFEHVCVIVEAGNVEVPMVPSGCEGLNATIIKSCARNGTATIWTTGAVSVAKGVCGTENQPILKLLFPHNAVVQARVALTVGARTATCIEDQLLEVVVVRPAAFVQGDVGGAIGVAPVLCEIARERVLPADSQLAVSLALKTDPGVAVEQHAPGIHVPCRQLILAFKFEDELRTAFLIEHGAAFQPPAVAAKPRDLHSDRRFPIFGLIGLVGERSLQKTI